VSLETMPWRMRDSMVSCRRGVRYSPEARQHPPDSAS
jgi:hypothetical protein